MSPASAASVVERPQHLEIALRLERLTLIWMMIEALGSIGAGLVAGSLLLIAFGIDSVIELISAVVLFRRLKKESGGRLDVEETEKLEGQASSIAGWLLYVLATYVVVQAVYSLWSKRAAEASLFGIAIAIVAVVGMPILAKAKLRIAAKISSRALRADAMETLTCGYLAWLLLAGLIANALLHWWWLDSAAALLIVPVLIREAKEALAGKCCYQ